MLGLGRDDTQLNMAPKDHSAGDLHMRGKCGRQFSIPAASAAGGAAAAQRCQPQAQRMLYGNISQEALSAGMAPMAVTQAATPWVGQQPQIRRGVPTGVQALDPRAVAARMEALPQSL